MSTTELHRLSRISGRLSSSPTTGLPVKLPYEGVNQTCKPKKIDYLIVTRPLFAKSTELQKFALWKMGQGFHVGLLTAEWINANYTGSNLAAKIKAAIHDTYARSKVKYVLLVGDTEVDLPADYSQGWYEPTEMYDLKKQWNIPTGVFMGGQWIQFSDFYYADAHPFPCDSQGKPYVPSPCYLDFDVMVGRFPVRAPQEITNIFLKSKTCRPTTSLTTIVAADCDSGADQCTLWPPAAGDAGQEDACYGQIPYSIQRALSGTSYQYTHNVLNIYTPGGLAQARNIVFNSVSTIQLVTHGGHDGNFVFGIADLGNFNTVFPLYLAISCLVNTYYYGQADSLTEAMIKHPKGPAVIARVNNNYAFYKALAEGKTIGEALYSRQKIYYGGGIATCDLLGDPSLRMLA